MNKIKIFISIVFKFKNFYLLLFDYLGFLNCEKYILKTRSGLSISVRSKTNDKSIVREILVSNDYTTTNLFIKNGDTVFDIGANIGIFSCWAAHSYKDIKIHSFEPEFSNYEILKEQIEINSFTNINVHKSAISSKKGVTKLYMSPNAGGHSVVGLKEFSNRNSIKLDEYQNVETIDLSTYLKTQNIKKIDFLKMDIEGGEYDILYNLKKETFDVIDRISMEYHYVDESKNGDELKKFLIKMNYSVEIKYPMLYAIKTSISE